MTEEIVCFDVETTGLSPEYNHIIQLSMVRFNSKTFEIVKEKTWYIKPPKDFTIDSGAQKVHGISKEYILEHGVGLRSIYHEIIEMFGDCDVLTYNGNSFDIKFLYNNLKEVGLSFDFNRRFYDSYIIERGRNSRRLTDVYKHYTGHDFDNAHDAAADVKATIEVFKCQQAVTTEDIEKDEFSVVTPDNFVILKDMGLVMANGKYKDRLVVEICDEDQSYMRWLWDKASTKTKTLISEAYRQTHPEKKK